jgi:hypothetical protein
MPIAATDKLPNTDSKEHPNIRRHPTVISDIFLVIRDTFRSQIYYTWVNTTEHLFVAIYYSILAHLTV